MTNNKHTPSDPTPESAPSQEDPRYNFAQIVSVAGDLISGTDPAHMSNATPCAEYTVAELTGHMVAVMARVAAVARGEDPFSVPQIQATPTEGSWHDAWMERAHEVQVAWTDPAVLGRDLTLPFGVLPGGAALTIYCGEIAVHAWDLATATGRTAAFDDAWLTQALEASKFGVPAEGRGEEMPFDPVVEVSADAPVVEQVAAWLGHQAAT